MSPRMQRLAAEKLCEIRGWPPLGKVTDYPVAGAKITGQWWHVALHEILAAEEVRLAITRASEDSLLAALQEPPASRCARCDSYIINGRGGCQGAQHGNRGCAMNRSPGVAGSDGGSRDG